MNRGKQRVGVAALVLGLAGGAASAGPFQPDSLVVYRAGDGVAPLTNAAAPVFLDEYSPAGLLVQSIPLPTLGSGPNRALTAQGTATLEGLINRSTDGRFLLISGYDATVGTATPANATAATVNRVVGIFDALGTVNTSTALTDWSDGGSPRSVISIDGSNLWLVGAAGGVRLTTPGSITSSDVSTTVVNLRHVDIFGGQLYISTASTSPGAVMRIAQVGTGTPTTPGQTMTSLPGVPTSGGSPVGFFMADLSTSVTGLDTLYVADDGAGLLKYSLVDGTWTANGTVGVNANDFRGVTGAVGGSGLTLYLSGPSAISRFVDITGYNGTVSGSATVLANAPANTLFKGMDFAPIPEPSTFGIAGLLGMFALARRRRRGRERRVRRSHARSVHRVIPPPAR
jgi:hypothetical protein